MVYIFGKGTGSTPMILAFPPLFALLFLDPHSARTADYLSAVRHNIMQLIVD